MGDPAQRCGIWLVAQLPADDFMMGSFDQTIAIAMYNPSVAQSIERLNFELTEGDPDQGVSARAVGAGVALVLVPTLFTVFPHWSEWELGPKLAVLAGWLVAAFVVVRIGAQRSRLNGLPFDDALADNRPRGDRNRAPRGRPRADRLTGPLRARPARGVAAQPRGRRHAAVGAALFTAGSFPDGPRSLCADARSHRSGALRADTIRDATSHYARTRPPLLLNDDATVSRMRTTQNDRPARSAVRTTRTLVIGPSRGTRSATQPPTNASSGATPTLHFCFMEPIRTDFKGYEGKYVALDSRTGEIVLSAEDLEGLFERAKGRDHIVLGGRVPFADEPIPVGLG